jgi:hypothetical protein
MSLKTCSSCLHRKLDGCESPCDACEHLGHGPFDGWEPAQPSSGAASAPEKQPSPDRARLRAEFAGRALGGLLACPNASGVAETLAKASVEYADALLAELDRTEGSGK